MTNLGLHCANHELKESIRGGEAKVKSLKKRDSDCLQKLVEMVRFDLLHNSWSVSYEKVPALRRKGDSESTIE